jgi:phage protein U
LILGGIPFGVNTTTYNRITKIYSNSWVAQQRINNSPALQNTGEQAESMTISGLSFPNQNIKARATLLALKVLASSQNSQFLFDLDGFIYGKWAITNIQQENNNQDNETYSIQLQRYPESSLLDQAANLIGE